MSSFCWKNRGFAVYEGNREINLANFLTDKEKCLTACKSLRIIANVKEMTLADINDR